MKPRGELMKIRTLVLAGFLLTISVTLASRIPTIQTGLPEGSQDDVCFAFRVDAAPQGHPPGVALTLGPAKTFIEIAQWARRQWQRFCREPSEQRDCARLPGSTHF
jgi:hypothetical protein